MRRGLIVAAMVVFLLAALSGIGFVVAGGWWYTLIALGLALRVAAEV